MRTDMLIIAGIVMSLIPQVLAIGPISCTSGSACELGDFYYNDSFVPYTETCCYVEIRYPNGTMVNLTNPNATANTLGYGFHNFSYTCSVPGFHSAILSCSIGACVGDQGNQSRSFICGEDTDPPSFLQFVPGGSQSFTYSGPSAKFDYAVSVTSNNGIANVVLEFDGNTNFSATLDSVFHNATSTGLGAGLHSYRWYAEDSTGLSSYSQSFSLNLVNPSTQPLPSPPTPSPIPEDFNISVSPLELKEKYSYPQPLYLNIFIKNNGEPANISVNTDLFDNILINYELGDKPKYFLLDSGEMKNISIIFVPLEQTTVKGELRVLDSLNGVVETVDLEFSIETYYPFTAFTGNLIRGRFDISPITVGFLGSYSGVPKYLLFAIPALLIVGLQFFRKEKNRLSVSTVGVLLAVLLIAVTLFVPVSL